MLGVPTYRGSRPHLNATHTACCCVFRNLAQFPVAVFVWHKIGLAEEPHPYTYTPPARARPPTPARIREIYIYILYQLLLLATF